MSSPQVQQWLDDGTRLADEMKKTLEDLEEQQRQLQEKLDTQRREVAVMLQVLERAAHPPDDDKIAGANFNSKAGSASHKGGSKDEWHPGV